MRNWSLVCVACWIVRALEQERKLTIDVERKAASE